MHTLTDTSKNNMAAKITQMDTILEKPAVAHQRERLQQYRHFSAPVHALLALDAGRMGSWSLDVEAGEVVGDRFVAQLLGFSYEQQPWPIAAFFESVHPDDQSNVQEAVAKAFSGETQYYDTIFRTRHTDSQNIDVWLGARGQVTERSEDGTPLRVVGVNWNASEQKMYEHKLSSLAAEMDHRIKNAFSVILALVNLGDKTSDSKADFALTLRAQVEAMATAHALSARMARTTADADTNLSILDIIKASLAPWLGPNAQDPQRVVVNCDADILIPPRKVSPLAMILYEISTNATKHGALATTDGKVDISITRQPDNGVLFVWTETTMENTSKPDAKIGLGTVLLEHCAQNLGGSVTQTEDQNGLKITLAINLSD